MPNQETMQELLQTLDLKYEQVKLGGGKKRIEAQHQKGKLTARERIDYLIDTGSYFLEIGAFTADGMYADEGGCPSGGVVAGIGYVSGKQCLIVANDATVKAGAWFPIAAKKNLRAQEIAMENRLPVIYLVDSAGCTYQCNPKYLLIRSILGVFSEITPECLPWGLCKLLQLWEVVLQAVLICRSCPMKLL